MRWVDVKDFLLEEPATPIVDVRSPSEYAEGHIEGAVNLPLFSDDERAKVGTVYTSAGRNEALEIGLEIVGPKMNFLAKKAKVIGAGGKLKTHCWRGGLRSDKMGWLFELVGIDVTLLQGGYKAYRNELLNDFSHIPGLIVLQGATGTGKTMILHEMRKRGEQVFDLERRANHKGSAFGALGMGEQPTTAQFQNQLYADLLKLNLNRRIWIESESLSIGKVYLPETLWQIMNTSNIIEIKVDKDVRVERIVEEYGNFPQEQLIEAIQKIRNRFGGDRAKQAITHLEDGKMRDVVHSLLDYYDKSYAFSKNKYKKKETAVLNTSTGDPCDNAEKLINLADKLDL